MVKKQVKKKVAKTKSEAGSGEIHLKIEAPLSIRRELLGSAISITKLMKNYETSQLLIEKKEKLFEKMWPLIREITKEFSVIEKEHLPEFKQEWAKLLEEEDTSLTRGEVKEIPKGEEKPKILNEVEKINRELEEIEKKLAALS